MSYFAKKCLNCGHPNEVLAESIQRKAVEHIIQRYLFKFLSTIITVVIAVYFLSNVFDFNLVAFLSLTCMILFWTTLIALTMNKGYSFFFYHRFCDIFFNWVAF